MKRIYISVLISILCIQAYGQEAIIYYEGGVKLYPIEYYAYEFQVLVDDCVKSNVTVINDSIFLAFLDKKIESAEKCTSNGDCLWATDKPSAMIQIVYIKDKYCYYTINLSSGWDIKNSLTIDGKSYIPDDELQDIVLEIVKFRVINKRPILKEELYAIMKGARLNAPNWPFE